MPRLIPYITLWLIFFGYNSSATAKAPAYELPGYSVMHFTDENGLPQNSIKSMGKDAEGYIWIATEAGLVRYDGRIFRLFSKEEMQVRHPRIYFMGRSPFNNQLYAYSEENDEVVWKGWQHKQIFYKLPLWLSDSALTRRYGHPLTSATRYLPIDYPPLTQKHLLIPVAADTFYMVTPNHVIYRTLHRVLWQTTVNLPPNPLLYWQNKRLYTYTDMGAFTEITSEGAVPVLQIPRFKRLVWNQVENQAFALTHDHKIYRLIQNAEGKPVTELLLDYFTPDFEISTLFLANKLILYVGGGREGLLVYKKQQFKTLGADLPDNQSILYAIYPHNAHTILTSNKKFMSLQGQQTLPRLPDENNTPYNRSLCKTRNGTYLISQEDSVLAFTNEGKPIKTIPFGTQMSALYTDRQNRTWAAAVDSGIYQLNDDLQPYARKTFPSIQYVNYMLDITDELFLVGTRNGLFWFTVNSSQIKPYPQTQGYNVRSIFRSKEGVIYLCTYGDGIIMLGPSGPIPLPEDRAGYLNTAHCMQEDNKGRVWISTNKGLFYTHEKYFRQYAANRTNKVYYHYIDKSSGLGSNEFNGGCQPCGLYMPSGDMLFPSMSGLVVFNPDSIVTLQPKEDVYVEKVVIDDRIAQSSGDTISVKRTFKRLEIFLSTPFYGSPENLAYEYTFDTTLTNAWVPLPSTNGSITFTSLPPGYSYITFRQKKIIGLGSFSYLTLTLYKPKAFWELPYFWPACGVLVWVLVFLAVRLRTRTLKQRNLKLAEAVHNAQEELLLTIHKLEKKTQFQQWLTSSIIHDLRGPLRFIKFYTGDIRKEEEEINAAQNKFLKSVYFSSLKIYNYSENLVQLLRIEQTSDFPAEKTDFWELVEDKADQFREQAKWNGITLQIDPDSDPFLYVNRAALSIILQNLLDNSIKNFKNGHIHVSLHHNEHSSVVEIRDEGPGLQPEQLQKFNAPHYDEISRENGTGLGIWLVKSLMAQTEGHIHFKNLPQKGLSIILTWQTLPV